MNKTTYRALALVVAALVGGLIGYLASVAGASLAIRNATERTADAHEATRTVMELAAADVAEARAERDAALAELERRKPKTVQGAQ